MQPSKLRTQANRGWGSPSSPKRFANWRRGLRFRNGLTLPSLSTTSESRGRLLYNRQTADPALAVRVPLVRPGFHGKNDAVSPGSPVEHARLRSADRLYVPLPAVFKLRSL